MRDLMTRAHAPAVCARTCGARARHCGGDDDDAMSRVIETDAARLHTPPHPDPLPEGEGTRGRVARLSDVVFDYVMNFALTASSSRCCCSMIEISPSMRS